MTVVLDPVEAQSGTGMPAVADHRIPAAVRSSFALTVAQAV
jgi:hypothetical protein